MKKIANIFILVGLVIAGTHGIMKIKSSFEFENEHESYWNLSVKASTIKDKIQYLDVFVKGLDESDLKESHNAVIWCTPDNSFNENMKALKSLQQRLHEIKDMNPNSFQYQTAMQQITGQEQYDATHMISELYGCWRKYHYFWNWSWIGGIQISIGVIFLLLGLAMRFDDSLF